MKANNTNKLTHMTEIISANLESLLVTGNGDYEYSASFGGSKARHITGLWKVVEHTVDGIPYGETFAKGKFGDKEFRDLCYESTFEFTRNICVKRMMICAAVMTNEGERPVEYDYRMNLAFMFELHKDSINVLPLLGYQFLSLDDKPGAVRELPPSTEWLTFRIQIDDDAIVIEDGTDIKKLRRANA